MTELEDLLTRLYSPDSTNVDRLQINRLLDTFSHQEGVWNHCIYILQHSSNEYTVLYALHVIETLIVQTWQAIPPDERLKLRQFLMEYLITKYSNLPSYFRNKLVHVVVLIGRSDWPHFYPDFMDHVIQIVKQKETTILGLSLLQTTSEELATPKMDLISSTRCRELHSLMIQQLPRILDTLVQLLNSALWLHPSYTSSIQTPVSISTSPFISDSPFVLQLPPEVCTSALSCLNHLFSWIPLSQDITPDLLEIVFRYASLGCLSGSDVSEHSGNLGSIAMDCVNELLIKNCVPQEFELFLMKLFDQSFSLLQRLTRGVEGEERDFSRLDDRYLAKCADFFDYFVTSHLKRVEFNPNFPVLEFLALFGKYTFKQPEIDSFCVCLDTWNLFLDHLIIMSHGTSSDLSPHSNKHYERYQDILISMTRSVLEKLQFHYNLVELREIDDDSIDSDNETEWDSFLRHSLELVGRVAELFPMQIFQMIIPLLEQYSQIYLSLSQVIVERGKDRILSISVGTQCENLHAVLKDLTTVLQALGRLAEHFSEDHFVERLHEAQQLMNQFCVIARYSTETQLFNIETPMPDTLEHDFIELHAQVFGTIQAYQHWLSEFHLATLRGLQNQDVLSYFISSAIESAVPVISRTVPEKISLSACRLFLSISSTIKPHYILQYPHVQELLLKATNGELLQLPLRVSVMLYQALVSMLILPWSSVNDDSQSWDARYSELCKVVNGITNSYHQYVNTSGWSEDTTLHEQAKPVIKQTLYLLQQIIALVENECKKSKTLLYQATSSCILEAIPLVHTYITQPDVLDVLMGFFYTIFKSLLSEVGPTLTEQITQTFMSLLTKEHLEETILQEDGVGNKVVEKFLNLLQLLVQECRNVEKPFLPVIISFTMKQIYPAISNKELPEVKLSLYSLLFQLLLNNWRYFYPANVLVHMDGDNDTVKHQEEFTSIMEAFGQAFIQSDITIFRQNLVALETLDEKKKLFSRPNFKATMRQPFLQVLLQVLTQKSHTLLQDEMCSCIYRLASVDFMSFYTEFLPKFIGNIEGLTEEQKIVVVDEYKIVEDIPSFIQNLIQLVADLRYYLIVNATLPPHSVKLTP